MDLPEDNQRPLPPTRPGEEDATPALALPLSQHAQALLNVAVSLGAHVEIDANDLGQRTMSIKFTF